MSPNCNGIRGSRVCGTAESALGLSWLLGGTDGSQRLSNILRPRKARPAANNGFHLVKPMHPAFEASVRGIHPKPDSHG